ncbi:signal peptide peptidase SppA [Candidatus Woesearchaeota archaeon]|nr:signal peptide peptidase SppA [Candidatus Woesearchaeota archaeon]
MSVFKKKQKSKNILNAFKLKKLTSKQSLTQSFTSKKQKPQQPTTQPVYIVQKRSSFWRWVWIFFIVMFFINLLFPPSRGNVAVIKIDGVITTSNSGLFASVESQDIVSLIKKAADDDHFKAIVLEINSPGGSAVASEEIVNAVLEARQKKPVIAWIRDIGASGAYWVASAADYIIASKASIVGSIGVKASYVELAGFIERYNATYQELTSGEFKDMASPFKHLTLVEKQKILEKLRKIHEYFKTSVKANRNLTTQDIERVANGEFFIGLEGKELKLIDAFGSKQEVKTFLEEKLNTSIDFESLSIKKSLVGMFKSFGAAKQKAKPSFSELLLVSDYFLIEAK